MELLSMRNSPEKVAARTAAIREAMLREPGGLRQANFERIGVADLARLFEMYDRDFFEGHLADLAKRMSGRPIVFRLSSTMTRAGGKTSLYHRRTRWGKVEANYEIAVSSRMLFMSFKEAGRPVVVCGLACHDRLEALQRIMEHELIHLAEMMAFGKSRCTSRRFKTLAANIFGHAGTTHELVTPREHAFVEHGIRVGGMVQFEFDGRMLVGRVNRINHHATVLVDDPRGLRYSDGGKYRKFYVPLDGLSALPLSGGGSG